MPKKQTTARKGSSKAASAVVVLVTAMADFTALSVEDRQIRFAEKAQVNRVSFSEMGKLHYLISEDIAAWNAANPKKKQRTIYDELRKRGVADKSISNASYASRAWRALVVDGHITEAAFDSLTFQDCFAIARSMSQRAALQLDAAAVGEIITKQPDDFDAELASLYEHGVTVAEKKAQDEKTEADRIKALVDAQNASKNKPAETPTPTKTTPAQQPSAQTTQTGPQTESETETETPEAETEQLTEAACEVPSNVTPMPEATANTDANLDAMLDVLNEITAESEAFTPAGQATLLAKLDEVRAAVAARIESAAAA